MRVLAVCVVLVIQSGCSSTSDELVLPDPPELDGKADAPYQCGTESCTRALCGATFHEEEGAWRAACALEDESSNASIAAVVTGTRPWSFDTRSSAFAAPIAVDGGFSNVATYRATPTVLAPESQPIYRSTLGENLLITYSEFDSISWTRNEVVGMRSISFFFGHQRSDGKIDVDALLEDGSHTNRRDRWLEGCVGDVTLLANAAIGGGIECPLQNVNTEAFSISADFEFPMNALGSKYIWKQR